MLLLCFAFYFTITKHIRHDKKQSHFSYFVSDFLN